jgi:hypothetical protein
MEGKMTRRNRRGLAFLLAGLVLAGLVAMPNPVIADVKVRVYVPLAPPPPPVEVVGVAPSRRHVWIAGYHRWDGRAHVWVPGHWVVRHRARAHWKAGHWARHRRGYYWIEGRWR